MKQFDQTFPTPPPSFGEDFNIQPINSSPTAIPPSVSSQNGYNQSPIPVQNGYKQSLTPNHNRYSPPQLANQNGYNHIAVSNQNGYSPTPVTNQNGYNTPVTNQNGFSTPVTNPAGFNTQVNNPKFNTQVTNPNGFNTQVTSPNGYNGQLANQNGFTQVTNPSGFNTSVSSPSGYNNSIQSTGTRVPSTNNSNFTQPLSHIPQVNSQPEFPNSQHHTGINPKFPPQTFDIPDINITGSSDNTLYNNLKPAVHNNYNYNNYPPNGVRRTPYSNFYPPHPALTTISPDIRAQLGFKHPMAAPGGSPGSNHTSPGRESSEDSDDSLPLAQLVLRRNKPVVTPGDHTTNHQDTWSISKLALKRSAPVSSPPQGNNSNSVAPTAKKAKGGKKKKKRDPNEPQKPVSAYALFFRDTQAAIKGQNPNASFGEVSKIVASMWDSLEEDQKNAYKKKTENAKKEYLKQLAAYRASLVSKGAMDPEDPFTDKGAPPVGGGRPLMANPRMSPMQDPGMGYPPPPGMMPHPQNPAMNHPSPEQQPTSPHMMQMHDQQAMHSGYPDGMGSPGNPMCVRNGCQNNPIENPGWDNEYCSSGCVVDHCRDVFTAWVASRQNTYASVK